MAKLVEDRQDVRRGWDRKMGSNDRYYMEHFVHRENEKTYEKATQVNLPLNKIRGYTDNLQKQPDHSIKQTNSTMAVQDNHDSSGMLQQYLYVEYMLFAKTKEYDTKSLVQQVMRYEGKGTCSTVRT
ncbi:hypothetical protein HPP92_018072 [Vanilla planifolia]|uniref:Uncharacterized protein n=1 Tax=Vanilla planifolia TaxID=51239 RepID=A0A835ULX6_VANPL|nr:hypothetical protein HPP92_018072 [Vanilla planifolia]